MGYASSNFIFIINHPSVIFHYAVRLVQSPSLIIAVCSVAGNYLVTVFLHGNVGGRRIWEN